MLAESAPFEYAKQNVTLFHSCLDGRLQYPSQIFLRFSTFKHMGRGRPLSCDPLHGAGLLALDLARHCRYDTLYPVLCRHCLVEERAATHNSDLHPRHLLAHRRACVYRIYSCPTAPGLMEEYWTVSTGVAVRNGWSCRDCKGAIAKGMHEAFGQCGGV